MRLDARAEKQLKATLAELSLTDRSGSPGGILPLQTFALRAHWANGWPRQTNQFLIQTGNRHVDATFSHR